MGQFYKIDPFFLPKNHYQTHIFQKKSKKISVFRKNTIFLKNKINKTVI